MRLQIALPGAHIANSAITKNLISFALCTRTRPCKEVLQCHDFFGTKQGRASQPSAYKKHIKKETYESQNTCRSNVGIVNSCNGLLNHHGQRNIAVNVSSNLPGRWTGCRRREM